MEFMDNGGEGVSPRRRAQQIVGRGEGGRPVAQRLVDGVLERARAGGHRHDPRPHELHALDVGLLAHDIGGPHVDRALQAQQRAYHGGGGAVLPGTGLGDDAGLAHASGQERLAHHLVALVRSAVNEILALEEDPCAALARQVAQLGDRSRTSQIPGEELIELGVEGGVGLRLDEGVLELVEGRHQQLGHELPTVGTEVGIQPRVVATGAFRAPGTVARGVPLLRGTGPDSAARAAIPPGGGRAVGDRHRRGEGLGDRRRIGGRRQ